MTMRQPVPTKGTESAPKALRWQEPARRKEQGNERDSIEASQFTIIFFTVKNKWREMWAKNKPASLLCILSTGVINFDAASAYGVYGQAKLL